MEKKNYMRFTLTFPYNNNNQTIKNHSICKGYKGYNVFHPFFPLGYFPREVKILNVTLTKVLWRQRTDRWEIQYFLWCHINPLIFVIIYNLVMNDKYIFENDAGNLFMYDHQGHLLQKYENDSKEYERGSSIKLSTSFLVLCTMDEQIQTSKFFRIIDLEQGKVQPFSSFLFLP